MSSDYSRPPGRMLQETRLPNKHPAPSEHPLLTTATTDHNTTAAAQQQRFLCLANLAMMENQAGPSAGDEASAFLCFCVAATTRVVGGQKSRQRMLTEIPGQKNCTVPTLKAHADTTMRTQGRPLALSQRLTWRKHTHASSRRR